MKTLKTSAVVRVAALIALLMSVLNSAPAFAALSVANIFRADMVLQQGVPVPVFGTADPGAIVTVEFLDQSVSTIADGNGSWQVNLASMTAGAFPSTMTIKATSSSPLTLTGVQVGEVWVCSGQSNMDLSLSDVNDGLAAIADSPNHNIRLFRMVLDEGPADAAWSTADTSTTPGFSAVCYWMGLELSQTLGVPIGLIQATHDGTAISKWMHSNGGTGEDYDSKIRPIQPFAVSGIAWYQGGSNGRDKAYEVKLRNLIGEWRTDWGLFDLPFGIVQLTWRPIGYTACREAQLRVSQTVANTFLVVTTDIPVSNPLHPKEKKPAGTRLAIAARGAVYGEDIEHSGPIRNHSASYISGNTIVINFTHLGNGLFTGNGEPPGPFKIAGADGIFYAATAAIVGDTVQVRSSTVSAPKTVRYQWDYGVGNLYNWVSIPTEGDSIMVDRLPASQFELKFR